MLKSILGKLAGILCSLASKNCVQIDTGKIGGHPVLVGIKNCVEIDTGKRQLSHVDIHIHIETSDPDDTLPDDAPPRRHLPIFEFPGTLSQKNNNVVQSVQSFCTVGPFSG